MIRIIYNILQLMTLIAGTANDTKTTIQLDGNTD